MLHECSWFSKYLPAVQRWKQSNFPAIMQYLPSKNVGKQNKFSQWPHTYTAHLLRRDHTSYFWKNCHFITRSASSAGLSSLHVRSISPPRLSYTVSLSKIRIHCCAVDMSWESALDPRSFIHHQQQQRLFVLHLRRKWFRCLVLILYFAPAALFHLVFAYVRRDPLHFLAHFPRYKIHRRGPHFLLQPVTLSSSPFHFVIGLYRRSFFFLLFFTGHWLFSFAPAYSLFLLVHYFIQE